MHFERSPRYNNHIPCLNLEISDLTPLHLPPPSFFPKTSTTTYDLKKKREKRNKIKMREKWNKTSEYTKKKRTELTEKGRKKELKRERKYNSSA